MPAREGLPDPRLLAFGLHLRRLREERGLSIEALAARAGLSARQLIRVEHGRGSPSVLWVLAVAEALDLPPGRLFEDRNQPEGGE